MRTKAILLTAALAAAGLNTATAQDGATSENVVGFVNVEIASGFNLVATPLASEDNTVSTLFADAPAGTTVFTWNTEEGMFNEPNVLEETFGGEPEWTRPDETLDPGSGYFVNNPEGAFTVTYVGEVMQGTLETSVPTGFSLQGSKVPQTGPLATAPDEGGLGFPAEPGDVVFKWDASAQQYVNGASGFAFEEQFGGGATWNPSEPEINVAEGFWVQNNADSSRTWAREFSVE